MTLALPTEEAQLLDRPSWRRGTSTQFVIFNLFGDYIMPRGGAIWTSRLLYLLGLLGIGERAARSTLSRMKQEGWLATRKQGRRAQHLLTRRGRAILEQGNQRIFEPPIESWDGLWRLVVYSLPEEKRELRNDLRKKLVWYGFGNLSPGAWVSPHDWLREVEAIIDDLALRPYVSLFTGRHVGAEPDHELVQRCWDLPALQQEYAAFVEHYAPEYALAQLLLAPGGAGLAAERRFVRRFWLTYDFQPFPRRDPNLPPALLPTPWVGTAARQLFSGYRRLLSHDLGEFLDQALRDE